MSAFLNTLFFVDIEHLEMGIRWQMFHRLQPPVVHLHQPGLVDFANAFFEHDGYNGHKDMFQG